MATITGPDGMVQSEGHNDNFDDGNATARMNHLGAMQEDSKFDGPGALKISDEPNQFAGHTAAAPSSNGMGE